MYKIINILKYFTAVFSILVLIYSCSEKKTKIVAEIGDKQITLDEYKIGYLNVIKKPDVFDSKELREQFLTELIRTRIIADEAYNLRLDTTLQYEYRFEAYLNKALREEHFEKVIRPEIKYSEEEIENTYLYTQEERKLSHLFFKTKETADSAYKLLQSGIKFEDLARQVFSGSELQDSGGDLGWVYWDQMDYDMARNAFTLPVDSISQPVRSTYGYHILKVTDFKKKPLTTRAEYNQRRQKIKYMLDYKIGDKLAYEYIHNIAGKADVDIKEQAYWFVHDKIVNAFKRRPTQFDQMYDLQLKEDEVQLLENSIWDERNTVIVTVNGIDYTVGQMIAALNYVPYEQIYKNFKGALDIVIRDFIITQEAKKMGLESDPAVQRKFNMFKEYTLQLDLRRRLVREVKVADTEIESYFNENKAEYKQASFESVYPIIKNKLIRKMKQDVVPNFVDSLTKGFTIKRYPEVINEYYDSLIGKSKL